jgi:hypothetical protein
MHLILRRAAPAFAMLCALWSPAATAADKLVDKSIVTLPKAAGSFTLVSAKQASATSGVLAGYTHSQLPPGVKLYLSVTPYGRMPAANGTTLDDEGELGRMNRNRQTLQRAADGDAKNFLKAFPGAEIRGRSEIVVSRPPSFMVSGTAGRAGKVGAVAQAYAFSHEGAAALRVATTVYRDLFVISLVAYSYDASVDLQRLAKIGSEAIHALVPLVDIRNFGSCGDTKAGDAYAMEAAIQRVMDESCAKSEADQKLPLPAGERITITYP